jgi:hypothetical protein
VTASKHLNGLQKVALREAILQTFDRAEFEILFSDTFGTPLGRISNKAQFKVQVFEAINWAERRARLDDLARAVAEQRPHLERTLRFAEPIALRMPTDVSPLSTDKPREISSLERLVRNGEGIDRYGPMLERLLAIQNQVCRVEAGSFGTGFLVAPDLVLTNFHVIEVKRSSGASGQEILCRFDYLSESSPGTSIRLSKSDWCLAHSGYAPGDVEAGKRPPNAGELDYALLKLERSVGDDELSGRRRGQVRVSLTAEAPEDSRILFIPQHPTAAPLSSSWGLSRGLAEGKLRLRYTAETLGGSSGSPVFDGDMSLVALHHAGEPGATLRPGNYNQGVPIALIAADLAGKSIQQFWE